MKALLYVVLLFALLLSACGVPTPPPTIEETFGVSPLGTPHPEILEKIHKVGGGDCSADRATGDLIKRDDPWCVYYTGLVSNDESTISTVPTNLPSTEEPLSPKTPKEKCNKGGGNGGEGCDPGKNPDKGNDDESGEKKKKDK